MKNSEASFLPSFSLGKTEVCQPLPGTSRDSGICFLNGRVGRPLDTAIVNLFQSLVDNRGYTGSFREIFDGLPGAEVTADVICCDLLIPQIEA
jgi:hypothetical protein